MPELSKHELDKLFRKGAERYDIRYNPAAWKQMEGMLDRRRRRWMVFWWTAGIAAFLILAGLAYCFFFREPLSSRDKVNQEPAQEETRQRPKGEVIAGKKAQELKNFAPRSPGLEEPAPAEAAGEQKANRALTPALSPRAEPAKQASRAGVHHTVADNPINRLPNAGDDAIEPQLPINAPANGYNSGEKLPGRDAGPDNLNEKKAWKEPLAFLPLLHLTPFRQISGAGEEKAPAFAAQGRQQPEQRQARSSHLVAGPGFSAGLNSIGWGDFSEGGWKAGLFAEYQYMGRLSLGLGASFLHMNYIAGKGEYMPPYGFWTRRIAPESTRGLCYMLEIPVLLKYYPGGYSGNGFFVSAGASSYVFLMEEYWYEYTAEDPDLIRWWQTGKDQAHWFALGQLAAGYQASLGSRLRLQVGPYLQIPFAGVGHGQVEIYSLGINARLLWLAW